MVFPERSPVPDFAESVVAARCDDVRRRVDERDGVDVVFVSNDLHRLTHRDAVVQVETFVIRTPQYFVAVLLHSIRGKRKI